MKEEMRNIIKYQNITSVDELIKEWCYLNAITDEEASKYIDIINNYNGNFINYEGNLIKYYKIKDVADEVVENGR